MRCVFIFLIRSTFFVLLLFFGEIFILTITYGTRTSAKYLTLCLQNIHCVAPGAAGSVTKAII